MARVCIMRGFHAGYCSGIVKLTEIYLVAMIFRLIRTLLTPLLMLLNAVTLPKKGQRSDIEIQQIKRSIRGLSLYQFTACPFCIKVRRHMRRLNLPIELRDAKNNPSYRQELLSQGGRLQAPCLRIEQADGSVQWLYESNDIVAYLDRQFPLLKS